VEEEYHLLSLVCPLKLGGKKTTEKLYNIKKIKNRKTLYKKE
jgi:hypothetical protein